MITQEEWIRRYKQHIIDKLHTVDDTGDYIFTLYEATEMADDEFETMGYTELVVGYEDDPEGSAEESLSYWDEMGDIELEDYV
jgi:hypothetical protein